MTPSGFDSSAGARLREARIAKNLSREDFAKMCGVQFTVQSHFEMGTRIPDASYLKKLMELGIDVHFVLTGHRDASSSEEMRLLNVFRSLSPEGKSMLLRAAEHLERMDSGFAPLLKVGNQLNGSKLEGHSMLSPKE